MVASTIGSEPRVLRKKFILEFILLLKINLLKNEQSIGGVPVPLRVLCSHRRRPPATGAALLQSASPRALLAADGSVSVGLSLSL